MMWFLQMAQLSTTMSQAQRATAFHCVPGQFGVRQLFCEGCGNTWRKRGNGKEGGLATFLTSKRFFPSADLLSAAAAAFFFAKVPAPGASVMSTSAISEIGSKLGTLGSELRSGGRAREWCRLRAQNVLRLRRRKGVG